LSGKQPLLLANNNGQQQQQQQQQQRGRAQPMSKYRERANIGSVETVMMLICLVLQPYALSGADAGTAMAVGDNEYGQLGIGSTANGSVNIDKETTAVDVTTISNATQISFGQYHALFLLPSGGVNALGKNGDGQLGNGATEDSTRPQPHSNPQWRRFQVGRLRSFPMR
jgi:alpha-tubulin suppressor-like RCC1 family protein